MKLGLSGVLLVIFMVLKLTGLIKWSWVWVLCPIWIYLVLIFIMLSIYLVIKVIEFLVETEVNK